MSGIAEQIANKQDKDGMFRRAMERIIQLYADKSHFIYELLQNAEDAEATQIKFIQYEDRLEVLHDGKPFTIENLRGLCDIGRSNKVDNLNQIGEFGVGFKSVFSICETVELFSYPDNYRYKVSNAESEFAIKISDFVCSENIQSVKLDKPYTTKFIFPYAVGLPFSGFKTLHDLKEKISTKLNSIGPSTLLFMKHLELISYEILLDSVKTDGEYWLVKEEEVKHDNLNFARVYALGRKVANSNDIKETTLLYLKFSRRIGDTPRTVDIAFPVKRIGENKFKCLTQKSPYNISVYFPTDTDSKLNFIVQGPYRTTPNRSSVPADDKDNVSLAIETAELLADALKELKNRKLLNMSFINALPLFKNKFSVYNLFLPLHDKVKELLSNAALSYIPTNSGDYISARFAVIARNEKLLELFDDALLTELMTPKSAQYRWLPSCLSRQYQVRDYFIRDLKISDIDTDNLKEYFDNNPLFLQQQSVNWLVKLYNFLEKKPDAFDKRSWRRKPNYLTTDIILTKAGEIIAPYKEAGAGQLVPNIFLPIDNVEIDNTDIEFVDEKVYNQCRHFFDEVLRLQQPDAFKLHVSSIKSRYSPNFTSSEKSHIEDVKFLLHNINNYQHTNTIQELIQNTFLIRCKDGQYRNASAETIYLPQHEGINIEEYLLNAAKDVHFADVDFYSKYDIDAKALISLRVRGSLLENEDITTGDYDTYLPGKKPKWDASFGFSWKLTLAYIDKVLLYISNNPKAADSFSKSQTIFTLLLRKESSLRGKVHIGGATPDKENEFCDVVKLLRRDSYLANWNGKWLYSESRELVAPSEVTKEEICKPIYGEVNPHSHVFEFLGFKETAEKGKNRSSDFEEELRIRYGLTLAGLDKLIKNKQLLGSQISNPPDFPSAKIRDWKALKRHVAEIFLYSEPTKYEYRSRHVRVTYNHTIVREYLRNLYGKGVLQDEFVCQHCRKATAFIAATEIFINSDTGRELTPMYLCLCTECARQYANIRRNAAEMNDLKSRIHHISDEEIQLSEPLKFDVRDNSRNFSLWFTQVHIAEIREILILLSRCP